MDHLTFLRELQLCEEGCDYILLPYVTDSSPIAHYRAIHRDYSQIGLLEEHFLTSLCQRDLAGLVDSISLILSEGSVFQRSFYRRFSLDHLNPPFHLESWIQFSKAQTVPQAIIFPVLLLFLAINPHSTFLPLVKRNRSLITSCDPLFQSFLSSLAPPTPPDFDNQDASLQRVLQLERSLPHAAKSSLQLAAEFMSLGKLDAYISSPSPMQGTSPLSILPDVSTRGGRRNRARFARRTAIEGIASAR